MRRLLIGIGKLFIGRALSVVSNMLIIILVARILGPTGLGAFATILAAAIFSSTVCKLGLEKVALVEAPRVGSNWHMLIALIRRMIPIFGLGIMLNFATMAAFYLIPSIRDYFSSFELIFTVGFFVIFFSYQFILGEFFRAREAFFWASMSKGGLSNLLMIAILSWSYFVLAPHPITLVALWYYMLSAVIVAALLLSFLFFSIRWNDKSSVITEGENKNHFVSAKYHLVTSLMIFLVTQSDIWISASIFSPVETGHYAAASRLVLMTTFLATLLNGLFTPKLSILVKNNDMKKFNSTLKGMSFLNASFGFVVIVVLFTSTDAILLLFFGEGFGNSAILLRILLLGQISSILVGPVGYALIILGQEKSVLFATIAGALTTLVLVTVFAFYGLSQIALALSYALGNVTLQFILYLSLKRHGISTLPSMRNAREVLYE